MINKDRLRKGAHLMKQYADTFDRIEQQYGVPPAVIVAVWGLESDFGAVTGNFDTIRSITTLAYDCRRSEMFTAELFDALRLLERGDFTPGTMRGAWAGEIGQTQFMPSSYLKFAVDFDQNRRRDLIHDVTRRACLDRQLFQELWLAKGRWLGAGPAEFRGDPAMEQSRCLCAYHCAFRDEARGWRYGGTLTLSDLCRRHGRACPGHDV